MKKKGTLIVGLCVLLLGASALMANSNWQGTYTGDLVGSWNGTIIDTQDPVRFEGEWQDEESGEVGKLKGTGDLEGRFYVFRDGKIYNEEGEQIGKWAGKFPAFDDALASGEWKLFTDEHGTWSGWSY
jgi:hypothetical protein